MVIVPSGEYGMKFSLYLFYKLKKNESWISLRWVLRVIMRVSR